MKTIYLPLPPRDEQDQIVRYLDWKVSQTNKLINAKRKQIGLLQEQRQAIFNETITKSDESWREISLGNLGSFRKGFGGSRADDTEDGVACIRYGDIYRTGAYVLKSPITRIGKSSSEFYARVFPSEVLFPLSGETKEEIGIAMVNEIEEDTWCSGDCAIFTSNGAILPRFLAYSIRCPFLVRQRASMSKGDIIVHISTGALRRLRILVPPVNVQAEIIEKFNRILDVKEKLETHIKQEITLLTEYRTRLISDVVTGKIDVRDVVVPEYEHADDTEIDDNADVGADLCVCPMNGSIAIGRTRRSAPTEN
jgi:type I restriction enzyme S subunit